MQRRQDNGSVEKKGKTIADYRTGRRIEIVNWPGTDQEIGILYLSCDDAQKAYFGAREWFKKNNQPVDGAAAKDFELEERYQTIQRMLVDPELHNANAKVCRTMQAARSLSPNEAEFFIIEHQKLQTDEAGGWYPDTPSDELTAVAAMFGVSEETETETMEKLRQIAVRYSVDGN
jgi:hypothetical protein